MTSNLKRCLGYSVRDSVSERPHPVPEILTYTVTKTSKMFLLIISVDARAL